MTQLTTPTIIRPLSPAEFYPNPHKTETAGLSGGLAARYGYTPTTGTRDEENTPVVVRIGEDNALPPQDPAAFKKVNECADEIRITELGIPVFKLNTGFRTILDWMIYDVHQNSMNSRSVMQTVNVIDGSLTPLQGVSDIYSNMINKPVVEMGLY